MAGFIVSDVDIEDGNNQNLKISISGCKHIVIIDQKVDYFKRTNKEKLDIRTKVKPKDADLEENVGNKAVFTTNKAGLIGAEEH